MHWSTKMDPAYSCVRLCTSSRLSPLVGFLVNIIPITVLPNRTLVDWSHGWSKWAVKNLWKLSQIGNSSDDTKLRRTMWAHLNAQLEHFRTVLATPNVGRTDPKELFRCVLQAGQWGLLTMVFHVHLIGSIRFLQSPIICYIFTLGVHTVNLNKNIINFIH